MEQILLYIILFITLLILLTIFLFNWKTFKEFVAKKLKLIKENELGTSSKARLIHELNSSILKLSKQKIGAIITITRKDSLENLRTDGVFLNSNLSGALLIAILSKNSPLHDGAIIIEGTKIKYVGTFYKISTKSVENKYGARHRAAIGITEESDAFSIIVSETDGSISIAINGKMSNVKKGDFQNKLSEYIK